MNWLIEVEELGRCECCGRPFDGKYNNAFHCSNCGEWYFLPEYDPDPEDEDEYYGEGEDDLDPEYDLDAKDEDEFDTPPHQMGDVYLADLVA
ncbi:MAG: hypothetical protein ACOCXQ_04490 [Patescibacteria group bacterium]